jgi:hypothetical protein
MRCSEDTDSYDGKAGKAGAVKGTIYLCGVDVLNLKPSSRRTPRAARTAFVLMGLSDIYWHTSLLEEELA